MHLGVVGTGLVAVHAVRQLLGLLPEATITVVGRRRDAAAAVVARFGTRLRPATELPTSLDALVLAQATGSHHAILARAGLEQGAAVLSATDAVDDTWELLALDGAARAAGRPLVVGAGFSPGLSCLLAHHAADTFDVVDEVHVAKSGTGGPACARQHHRALRGWSWDWRDDAWFRRRGSSGRQLAWFPDPIGARDCYRAALPEPLLLHRAFPGATRVTARMSATRRDRLTGWLPMMRPPHADGGPGAIRVEVWGRRGDAKDVIVYGAADHPALATGVVIAVATAAVLTGRSTASGAFGLAELPDVAWMIERLDAAGVGMATFEGAT